MRPARSGFCLFGPVIALAMALFPAAVRAAEPDSWDEERLFRRETQTLLMAKKYDLLEEQAERLRKTRPLFQTGRSKLFHFYAVLGQIPPDETRKEEPDPEIDLQDQIQRLEAWKAEKPTLTPRIALIKTYVDWAWAARGHDRASNVTGQGWDRFEKRLKTANELFLETRTMADKANPPLTDAYLQAYALGIALGQSWSRPRVLETLHEALLIDPSCYVAIDKASYCLQPRWGGSAEDLVRLAELATKWTKETQGNAAYAVACMSALSAGEPLGFDGTGFDWKACRQGLDDLLKRTPNSALRLTHALELARQAQDREAGQAYLARLAPLGELGGFGTRADYDVNARWATGELESPDVVAVFRSRERSYIAAGFAGPEHRVVLLRKEVFVSPLTIADPVTPPAGAKPPKEWNLPGDCLDLRVMPDGKSAIAAVWEDGRTSFHTVDLTTGKPTLLGAAEKHPYHIAISPDGKYFGAGMASGEIKGWELGATPKPTSWNRGASNALVFRPQGKGLFSLSNTTAKFWTLPAGEEAGSWTVHDQMAQAIACSHDGEWVATAGLGNEVQIWDAERRIRIKALVGGNTSLTQLAFSRDRRWLVGGTASKARPEIPGEVVVWDLVTDKVARVFRGHSLGIRFLELSADDALILSLGHEGTVRLDRLRPEAE